MQLRAFRLFAGIAALLGAGGYGFPQNAPARPAPQSAGLRPSGATQAAADESAIVEQLKTDVVFLEDGTGQEEKVARIRVLSAAGVQAFGVLSFPYSSANDSLEILQIRVTKPNGTAIDTPTSDVQDLDTQIAREAPLYSDAHQKEVPVKGLGIGDLVEWRIRTIHKIAQVPGQFWYAHDFTKTGVVLDEVLTVTVPASKYVKVSSPILNPSVRQEDSRKIYSWKTSHREAAKPETRKRAPEIQPRPSVEITTFKTWGEVGAWYAALQKPKIVVTPAIQTKADELTRGLSTPEDKERAIYRFVAGDFRYISISFGEGRFQPHSAEEVLSNRYGDCKDKHTLLATLLRAAGIEAAPALIGAGLEFDPDVPSPAQFNHVVTYIPQSPTALWLDTTPEVAPFGLLVRPLRDHSALVIREGSPAELRTVPPNVPFPSDELVDVKSKLSGTGTLDAHFDITARGDTEVILKSVFHASPPAQWTTFVQRLANAMGFAGTVQGLAVDNPTDTNKPLHYSYDYVRQNYSDWGNRRILPPLPPFGVEGAAEAERPSEPVQLGGLGKVVYRAALVLPAGYSLEVPPAANVRSDFADYTATYTIDRGTFTVQRILTRKRSAVPVAQWSQYQQFAKAMATDESRFIQLMEGLNTPQASPEIRPTVISPPHPAPEPQRATVIAESSPMYSKMSSSSPVVEVLHKDDQVTVDFSVGGPNGGWCSVTKVQASAAEAGDRPRASVRKSGSVPCDALLREPVIPDTPPPSESPRPRASLVVPATRAANIPPAPANTQVYFAPIGRFSTVNMEYLTGYYKQKFGLTIHVLDPIALEPAAFDASRQQYRLEGLIGSLKRASPALAADTRAIVIGITETDVYTSAERWQFAFALREEGHLAVVSSARMDLEHTNAGGAPDPVSLHRRLTRMLSRELGFMYYRLPLSQDPRSVVRASVLGTEELDEMGEEF